MQFLFDFDGTIAQSFDLIVELYNQLAPKYHLQIIEASMIEAIRNKGARELFKLSGLSPLQLPFLTADIHSLLAKRIATASVVPNLPTVLKQLSQAGHQLSVVTSNSEVNAKTFLTAHDLLPLFTFVCSEKNLWSKGLALKQVIRKNHLELAKTLYIGDEVRDIEAAREAGLRVAAVTWGFNSRAALKNAAPDFLLDQPAELTKIDLNR